MSRGCGGDVLTVKVILKLLTGDALISTPMLGFLYTAG